MGRTSTIRVCFSKKIYLDFPVNIACHTEFEFYKGAMGYDKPCDEWAIGVDFTLKTDDKTHSIEVIRKKDKEVCVITFYKAPCTKDVAASMKQFVDAMQYLGEMKKASVASLDTELATEEATLGEQMPKDAKGGSAKKGAAAAGGAAAGGGGGGGGGGGAAADGSKSEEIKDNLFEHTKDCPEGRTLSFENKDNNLQFKVTFTFKNPEGIKILDSNATKVAENKHQFVIYPGATLVAAKGKWNGQSRGIGSGNPDPAWVKKQAQLAEEEVKKETKELVALMKKDGHKKVTAETIAETCTKHQRNFLDLTFPPTKASLQREWETGIKDCCWKRPEQYLSDGMEPALFVGSVEPEDIDQGSLGDCYLLSALACLSEFEPLVHAVFDESQDYDYGIYRATVCKNGWWQCITMDSYLPSGGGGPCFAKNREEPNELWVALLEKAYAKIHGSYGAIRAGSGGQALADLTGCPYRLYDKDDMKPALFKDLLFNDENDYIQMLGTPGQDTSDYAGGAKSGDAASMSKKYENVGLACGHAYSLITVKDFKGNKLCMIRNPWGNDKEWNGDWSDKSKKWTADAKKAVGWYDGDDGTFWMCWEDVCKWFTSVSVCYMNGAWDQLRFSGTFDKGVADLVVKVEVKHKSLAWVGSHQRDSRGKKKGSPDAKYVTQQLNVLRDDQGKFTSLHTSSYKPSRDINTEMTFEKGKTYYILTQSNDEKNARSFVYSMHCEVSEFAKISFLTPKAGSGKNYKQPTGFTLDDYEPTQAMYQIKGIFSTNSSVVERVGAEVCFTGTKRVLTAKEKVLKKNPKGGKGLTQWANFPLEVTAIGGKNLSAMDDNGQSDPYLEMRLRGMKDGKLTTSHTKPQTQVCAWLCYSHVPLLKLSTLLNNFNNFPHSSPRQLTQP